MGGSNPALEGVPNPALDRGYPNLGWGVPHLQGVPEPWTGGYPVSGLGVYPISGWEVPHLRSGGGPGTPPVKGKIFDTRFGLIHVQTGKKKFAQGQPPSKGKNF